jgi:hypothetical protein
MLWAYLDDSSDDKRESFCAAGGFYTVDSRWKKLEADWRGITVGLEQPFHSTDCECGHGQFVRWEKPARDSLMADLCDLVRYHDLGAFGACVSVPEYKSVFPSAGKHDAYLFCVGLCFANIAVVNEISNDIIRRQNLPLPPQDVRFWVEESRDTYARATQVYQELRSLASWRPSHRLAGIAHHGKESIGLQTADLLAREVYKFYSNQGIRPIRKPVITLAQNISFVGPTLENLQEFKIAASHVGHAAALTLMADRITRSQAIPIK